jgi:opacity protein-like surface antigen
MVQPVRSILVAGILLVVASPVRAQVHMQVVGGATMAASTQPMVGADVGFRVSFLELDVEAGHLSDILPKGVAADLNALQRAHGLPVQAIASVPATYALGRVRLIFPAGPIKPFINGGLGVARLQPRLDVVIDDVSVGDVFGLTSLQPINKTLATVGGGVRFELGPHAMLDAGYRYFVIFMHFEPTTNVAKDRVLTSFGNAFLALGVKF